MADHSKPTTSSTYANFVTELDGRMDDLAVGFDPAVVTVTNPPTSAIRWSSSGKKWEIYSGASWGDLTTSYSININGAVGAGFPSTGAFTTLTTSGDPVFGSYGVTEATLNSITYGTHTVSANTATAALTVTQAGSGNIVTFEDAASDTTPTVIDGSGRMVNGHTTSIVNSDSVHPASQVHGSGTSSGAMQYGAFSWSATAAEYPNLSFSKSASNTIGTHSVVSSGANIGRISFDGSDGTEFQLSARIIARSAGTPGAGTVPGQLLFGTTAQGSAAVDDALVLDSQQRCVVQAGAAFVPTMSNAASGSTITLTNATSHLIYTKATTSAALTITLPSTDLQNGQEVTIASRPIITTLTINGGTIYGAPTTMAAGGFAAFIYSSTAGAWYRKG